MTSTWMVATMDEEQMTDINRAVEARDAGPVTLCAQTCPPRRRSALVKLSEGQRAAGMLIGLESLNTRQLRKPAHRSEPYGRAQREDARS